MHDFLIAMAFVAMVVSPALIAGLPKNHKDDE